jgi:hypothetical protein
MERIAELYNLPKVLTIPNVKLPFQSPLIHRETFIISIIYSINDP